MGRRNDEEAKSTLAQVAEGKIGCMNGVSSVPSSSQSAHWRTGLLGLSYKYLLSKFTLCSLITPDLERGRKSDAWVCPSPSSFGHVIHSSGTGSIKSPSARTPPPPGVPLSWSQPNHPFLQMVHSPAGLFLPALHTEYDQRNASFLLSRHFIFPNPTLINYLCPVLMKTS